MKPRLHSYFSGAGLFDLGLQRGGCDVARSYEIDTHCCATLRRNFRHEVVQGDMRTKLAFDEPDCDVMAATYPCNHYAEIAAIHRTRVGDELYLHFFRHLALRRPEVFVLENVPGMRKFTVVMEAMTRLPDYYVTTFCPVSSHLWLPQRRERLIIIGSRRPFQWRQPKARRAVTLAEIIERDANPHIPYYVKRRIRGAYRDKPIVSDPRRGDIAPTCVAHYAKDMGTRLIADRRFPYGVRPYTVREYARLQGVPDSFEFVGCDSVAFKMIGNGVSIPVGEWFGKEINRYFKR